VSADPAARARAWRYAVHAAVCDVVQPWDHGTVVRATRFPSYFDFNVVRVEEDPRMSAQELAAFADQQLAGLGHRRIDVEPVEIGDSLRPDFEALGWMTHRLVWMRLQGPTPSGVGRRPEEVDFDAVAHLRAAWFGEDFPGQELGNLPAEEREVAPLLGARVLAVREAGAPVAYAQLERIGRSAEISQVYVAPDHRGRGLGTALTRAAIDGAADADDLWIIADDEGRPKELYARLGFRPAWTAVQMLRWS
jgi:GNAT superfamily N-acetyltransferase